MPIFCTNVEMALFYWKAKQQKQQPQTKKLLTIENFVRSHTVAKLKVSRRDDSEKSPTNSNVLHT